VNTVMRRLFGNPELEVTGGWGEVHSEELHSLYSSLNKLVGRMYLSNTTLFGRGISGIYYIRYNYMFRRLTMAIFRLYM